MNGLCPWLWGPTLPKIWKPTIRLSLYAPPFRIHSPFNDSYRPNKTSRKLQVGYSARVFPMKLTARYRCWPELGTDSHRILGHWNDQRWTFLGWYFVDVLPQSVSCTLARLPRRTYSATDFIFFTVFSGRGNTAFVYISIFMHFLEVKMAGWVYHFLVAHQLLTSSSQNHSGKSAHLFLDLHRRCLELTRVPIFFLYLPLF